MQPNVKGTGEQTSQLMESLAMTVPGILQMSSQAIPWQEGVKANTALKTLGRQTDLTESQARTLASLGREFESEDVANRLNIMQGPGADFIRTINNVNQEVDPEFYKTRALTANRLGDLMGSINVNGLSEGELSSIERSVAKDNVGTGNLNIGSPTKTIQNALQFGREGQAFEATKKNQLTEAINAASAFLPSAKNAPDANASVFGTNSYQPTQFANTSNVGEGANALIGSLFGGTNQRTIAQNEQYSNAPSDFENVMGSLPDY